MLDEDEIKRILNMANPFDFDNVEELRLIAMFWLKTATQSSAEKLVCMDYLKENGLNPTPEDFRDRVKKKFSKVSNKQIKENEK